MPNHTDVVIEDMDSGKSVEDQFKKAPILRWGWFLASAIFLISLGLYFYHFHTGFSEKQEVWGQFGDFMGGLVNPIVGLFTIWLLTVSLNQSHLALSQTAKALKQSEAALKQSAAEIDLAKQALLDNQKIQASTEAALTRQIAVAEDAKDIANAMALMKHFEEVYNSFKIAEINLSPQNIDELELIRIR